MATLCTSVRNGYKYYISQYFFTHYGTECNANALVIAKILTSRGWTANAVAGILGNMLQESSLNPDIYYGEAAFSGVSYGLVQWDATSKYQNWADSMGYLPYHDIEYQCERISLELETGLGGQYLTRDWNDWYKKYQHISASEFIRSTETPYFLAGAFAWNYERSAVVLNGTDAQRAALEQQRGNAANKFYELITGSELPDTPDTPTPSTKRKFPWILMAAIATDID